LVAPPVGCDGGCSSVVPRAVAVDVPAPQGARSTATDIDVELRARRSAVPAGAGNVPRSMIRKRSRVRLAPELFVHTVRRSMVPNVALFAGSDVGSSTLFGAAD